MDEDLNIYPPYHGRVWLNHTVREWWMHRHSELECNLVVRGSARYLLHDRMYVLMPGTIVWLFPKQYHLLLEQSPSHCMWTVVLRPELLQQICIAPLQLPLLATDPEGYFCRRLDPAHAARLESLLDEVYRSNTDAARYNAGLAYTTLCLWAAYVNAEEAEVGGYIHPAVDRALQLVSAQPGLRMAELAQQCGLSVSQLSRVFHAQIGMPLVRFRSQQAVMRFFKLYGQGEMLSMHHAALEAGFGSYSQFHRVFSKLMGCPPAAWFVAQKKRRYTADEQRDDPFSSAT